MSEYITAIRTSTGDKQIDYNGLANLPDLSIYSEIGHKHDTSDITSGILPIERGGIGTNNLDDFANTIGAKVLTDVGNLHVWQRCEITTVKEVEISTTQTSITYKNDSLVLYCSTDVAISNDTVVLVDPVASTVGRFHNGANYTCYYFYTEGSSQIYEYISTTYGSSNNRTYAVYAVNAVDAIVYPVIDFPTSPNSTTYPNDGDVGDYHYFYVGMLGNNARIETGSYVGTGVYGSSNPNTLTFNLCPTFVIISNESYIAILANGYGVNPTGSSGQSNSMLISTIKNHTITWYDANYASNQGNTSGETYNYVAIMQ